MVSAAVIRHLGFYARINEYHFMILAYKDFYTVGDLMGFFWVGGL
jgi:hypothetical protein